MTLALRPLHPVFVAEASGLDLTKPISRAQACAINAAMNQYAVLVWRGQPLTAKEQIQFATAFGPLDIGLKRVFKRPERLEDERLIDISNVALDGTVQRRDSPQNLSNFANQLWHSDSSFMNPRAAYSMLHALATPSWVATPSSPICAPHTIRLIPARAQWSQIFAPSTMRCTPAFCWATKPTPMSRKN